MPVSNWIERADREPASFPSLLALSDGRCFPVSITNVSEGGCQVACSETLPIGANVGLKVGNKQIAAQVRWSLDGRAGLQLSEA